MPGIPIKVVFPEMHITLLDSVAKKVRAVREIVSVLQLKDTKVVCGRAEEIGKLEGFRGRYDFVICRAVARLSELIGWAFPFLKSGVAGDMTVGPKLHLSSGKLLALKGGELEREFDKLIGKRFWSPQRTMRPSGIRVVDLDLDTGADRQAGKKLVIVDFADSADRG